jgi:hypothetical protein
MMHARAVAHHNAFVMMRSRVGTIPTDQSASFDQRMLKCLRGALPVAPWLLMLPRHAVREIAFTYYVPVMGLAPADITIAHLKAVGWCVGTND